MRLFLLIRIAALEAHHHLMRHLARSWLTILGIAVGVAAVTLSVSLGNGTEILFREEMLSFGSRLGFVMPIAPHIPGRPRERVAPRFTTEQWQAVRDQATTVTNVEPQSRVRGIAKRQSRQYPCQLIGISAPILPMYRYEPVRGRFFTAADVHAGSAVAVLGPRVYRQLYEPWEDPVGTQIRFNNVALQVIGVAGKGSFATAYDEDMAVFTPHTTYRARFSGKDEITFLQFSMRPGVSIREVRADISRILRPLRHVSDPTRDNFQVLDMGALLDFVKDFLQTITLVFSLVAGIALVVAGVGLMNILLVSVAERTREFGLRKAAGASNTDLMVQCLGESLILTVTGGIVGVAAGWSLGRLVIPITEYTINIALVPVMPLEAIWVACGTMIVVGLVAGLYPAWTAARLDPIQAIHTS